MTIVEVVGLLRERNVALSVVGEELVARAEKKALDPAIVNLLRDHKRELIDLIQSGEYIVTTNREPVFEIPPNRIPADCHHITPDLLPLVRLTPAEIARIVDTVPGGAANVQDIYPLAPLQEGILFHHVVTAQGDPYQIMALSSFGTRKALDDYLGAIQAVIDRHDILRTAVIWGVSQPVQVVWRRAELIVQEVELLEAAGDVAQELRRRFGPRSQKMDLARAPLVRAYGAYDGAASRWTLLLLFHHLAIDHATMAVMREEIEAHLEGRAETLPPPLPFRNFIARTQLRRDDAADEAFFREMLGDVDAPTIPFGLREVHGDGRGTAEAEMTLDAELSRRLRERGRRLGVSAASIFHVAWARVLARTSGREDVVFGTVVFGRMHGGENEERVMGLFINTLPVRLKMGNERLDTGIRRLHAQLAALMQHESASLALAQRCSGVAAPAPLFSAILNYRHSDDLQADSVETKEALGDIEGLQIEEYTNYPLALSVDDLPDRFGLKVQVQESIEPMRVCALLRAAVERIVEALERAPGTAMETIDVLPPEERRLVLNEWNATDRGTAQERCIQELFEEQVLRRPDGLALVRGEERLTYAALNTRANQLAHHLRELGVRPDDRVALCTGRSIELVVGLLAVLKAGGAYVPLDPAYPAERLTYMVNDSAPRVVLTRGDVGGGWAEIVREVRAGTTVLELDNVAWSDQPENNPDPAAVGLTPRHLAYVIYTSGSTGQPKGVMVEHRGLCNLAVEQIRGFAIDAESRVLQFASASFDASVSEVMTALCSGASLHLAGKGTVLAGQALIDAIAEGGITHVTLPPAVFGTLGEDDALEPLQTLVLAGEAWPDGLAKRLARGRRLINAYGPTETTVCATMYECDGAERGNPPIGKPIGNTRLYVLDSKGEPVPVGAVGEIHVGGAGVARGYLNRPELTAQKFVRDPFVDVAEARMYRTGDLGRWLPDGNVEFLGRNDQQVKVRGFRIELGEIEARLQEHGSIREAVVLVRENEPGEKRLVAYVVARPGESADAEELREHLVAKLPEYMVPAAYVEIEALPLTANGKIDRKALPAPGTGSYATRAYEAPHGETEWIVAEAWKTLLHLDRVGRHDHFFEVGGDSLLAVQLISRLRQALGVEIALGALFAHPVLSELAGSVAEAKRTTLPSITPAADDEKEALSFAQQRLWFLSQLDPESRAYHIPFGLTLDGELDREALRRALDTLVERHEVLRTRFVRVDGEPRQKVMANQKFALVEHDLRGLDEVDAEVRRLAEEEADARFDLEQGPLIRGRLIRTAENRNTLLVTQHHIVSDGWSMGVLVGELSALYGAYREGKENPLQPLAVQYGDYAAWQRRWISGEVLSEQGEYWKKALDGAPALLEVPTDHARPAQQDFTGGFVEVELGSELTERVRELSRRHGTTVFMTLLGSWGAFLSRLSGQDEVIVGTPTANRGRGEIEGLIGFFVNTLAVRIDVTGSPTVGELLRRVKEQTLGAQQNQDMPFEQVVELIAPVRSLSHSPLFQAVFAWENPSETRLELPGLTLEGGVASEAMPAKFDLTLTLVDGRETIVGGINYATALFERETVERYAGHWRTLLEAMTREEARPVDELPLLTEAERMVVVEEWNDTTREYAVAACIHELFEEQVEKSPEATAVVYDRERVSYGELNARANRLAHRLRELGVGPDERVAICTGRCIEMVVGLMAVLKAGGAYVPLDPTYPAERLRYMLDDSAPRVVLTRADAGDGWRDVVNDVRATVPVLELDGAGQWPDQPETNPKAQEIGLAPNHLAYVIYTSGSTGRPKGVMVEHRGVCNLAAEQIRRFGVNADSRILQFASFSFDAAAWETIMALCSGASLHLPPHGAVLAGRTLVDAIEQGGITHATLPPAVFATLAEDEVLSPVRTLVLAGETLPAVLATRLARGRQLFNAYGPTETTVCATMYECDGGERRNPPIGRPIANTRLYILDGRGNPVPIGVAGEIHVGGIGVARGYLNRPELTAERFVHDRFSLDPAARMYRTGDRGRWLAGGNVEYLGRNDFQVKLRGFRIELGEIEARLGAHASVREAVVLARDDGRGDQRLVAYVIAEEGERVESEELKRHVAATLPEYMVPVAYVPLAAWPVTPNGKIDRNALPAPLGSADESLPREEPRGEIEVLVAEIWKDLLGLTLVGRHDNFFELGGHSLLAVRLMDRLRQHDLHADIRAVFTAPTIAGLAATVTRDAAAIVIPPNAIPDGCEAIAPAMLPLVDLTAEEIARVVALVAGGARNVQDIYPLAPLQEGILFHHLMAPAGDPYLVAKMYSFDTRQRLDAYLGALQTVTDRHDILRTAVAWEGLATPVQVVVRHARLPIIEVELTHDADAAEQLYEQFHPRRYRMDIRQAPLTHCAVARDPEDGRWLLLILSHHLVNDHSTGELLDGEIRMIVTGRADELPEPLPFRNYVAQGRLGRSAAEHEEFFGRMLADVDEPTTPFGLTEVHGDGSRIGEASRFLDADSSRRLRESASALGVSAASLFHVACALVVARASGREDVVFGTVLFGRMEGSAGADRAMGLFINTLPLRITVGEERAIDAIRRTHDLLGELMVHEHASLAVAQRCSGVPAPAPLFSAVVNYRHSPGAGRKEADDVDPLWAGIEPVRGQERTNYPLFLSIDDLPAGFWLKAQVESPVDPELVCRMLETALEELLRAVETRSVAPLASLDVLPAADRETLVDVGIAAVRDYPRETGVHMLFLEQAALRPEATAVMHRGRRLTYRELALAAARLAGRLAQEVCAGERVAVLLDRSMELVIAQLAVLHCGAVYVPLDRNAPAERHAFQLADADCRVVLTVSGVSLPPLAVVTRIDLDDPASTAWSPAEPVLVRADEPAYVMYTSGSTGQPKGVVIPHRGIAALVLNNGAIETRSDDRFAFTANPAFDASTFELWAPLLHGAAVVIIDQEVLLDPAALSEELSEAGVTVLQLVAGLLSAYVDALAAVFPRLRYLVTGGDRADAGAISRVLASPPAHLIQTYGPTETTTFVTAWDLCAARDGLPANIPIGPPIGNRRIYLLDRRGRPVPPGAPGEIHIGGDGVALGYLNRPQLTAERFLDDPFAGQGRTMYRTGDLARWLPNGHLEFLGRNDEQVKIRGIRIEPGEIEARLEGVPGIRNAVVDVRPDAAGEKQLVAYVVTHPGAGEETSPARLRQMLAEHLPETMVPPAFVHLDSLPLTPNGKVDRRALPSPDTGSYAADGYAPPQGPVETVIAEVWAALLGRERVGRYDNFFALGGHSLLAISLMDRLRRHGLHVDVRSVFTYKTLAALATVCSTDSQSIDIPPNRIAAGCDAIDPSMLTLVGMTQLEIDRAVSRVPGGAANVQDIYPLAPLQEGILFHHLMAGSGDPYLVPRIHRFDSRARLDAYVAALQAVIDRNDILRTSIVWDGLSVPVQVVWRAAHLDVEEMEIASDSGDAAETLLAQFDPRRYRIDLGKAPLIEARAAYDVKEDAWLLLLLLHHLIGDHTTSAVMEAEIAAILRGSGHELPPPVPFRNFVAQARLSVPEEEHEAFFQDLLGDFDTPGIPFGLAKAHGHDAVFHQARLVVDPAVAANLRKNAQRLGVTAASVVHLACALVLARISDSEDVVFGTVLYGRATGAATDRIMGLLINTLPVRIRIDDRGVEEGVLRTHEALAGLLRHEHASLALAQRCSGVPAPAPLFSALLNYRNVGGETRGQSPASRSVVEESAGYEGGSDPVVLSVDDFGDALGLIAKVDSSLDPMAVCDLMHTALERVVEALDISPGLALRDLDVLPVAQHQLLNEWNATDRGVVRERCIQELFEEQVVRRPDGLALVCGEERLSYAVLNARANQLAHHLRELGVRPDDRVAICTGRSVELIAGLLAVLKAGGAYVPLDPAYPAGRLTYMLRDSMPRLVLARGDVGGGWAEIVHEVRARTTVLELDGIEWWSDQPESNPDPAAIGLTPRHLAYVIYTSGSTGQPKGVMVEHRATCNMAVELSRGFGIDAESRVLQFASASFDAAVAEVMTALCSGASLHLAVEGTVLAGQALVDAISEGGITHATLPPAVFGTLDEDEELEPLQTLVLAGEAWPDQLAKRLARGRRLINGYGPTEATVGATLYECDGTERGNPLIGKPIGNACLYILDRRGEPVPIRAVGEIHIGGAGVARGYLNRPELTAQKFVRDPFVADSQARMYRTGDLGRWLPDGNVEFLGRNDQQVKVRGFRIELGEIEARLQELVSVREAVVLVREDEPGAKRLVAYVVARPGERVDAEELREHLTAKLPEYMVPAAYVELEALPLTTNGKIDRKALPAPGTESHATRAYEAPHGETEWIAAEAWKTLLHLDRVGRHDDFFEVGGDSLLAVQLISRLREALGVEIALGALFKHPVLSEFAASVAEAKRTSLPAITPAKGDEKEALSFAQQRLWFLSQLDPESRAYHIPFGLTLDGELDTEALRRALDTLVERHEVLRTRFVRVDGEPRQRVVANQKFALVEHDLRGVEDVDAEVRRLAEEEADARFDLEQGPLIRGRLIRTAEQRHTLLVTQHHIVSDGWSMGVLVGELSALYGAYREGKENPLEPLVVQYGDYAAWQRRWITGEVLSEQGEYWKKALHGAPALLEVPADHARPVQQDFTGGFVEVELGSELTERVRELSRRHGTTVFMTLLGSWGALLSRLSGQDDVVVGTPTANRGRGEIEGLIGFFVNTLAVRIDVTGSPAVGELLRRVKEQTLGAQQNQDMPFEQVVELIAPVRSLSHSPLFQAVFAWENPSETRLELPGLTLEGGVASEAMPAKFDLTLTLVDGRETIVGGINYATSLFERETVERYAGHWRTLLEAMTREEARPVDELPLLTEAERRVVVEVWNATTREYAVAACIHELFEEQVERSPTATAVMYDGERVSYEELNARANQLAHRLRELGVGPDERVAICLERSVELIVALVAVLKAGGAYVPLDPAYPAERLRYMLGDSAPKVLITGSGTDELAAGRDEQIAHVDLTSSDRLDYPYTNLERRGGPESLAYVIYTSGSTGTPKGVMVEHRHLANLIHWHCEAFGLEAGQRCSSVAAIGFDAAAWEVWPVLCSGAVLELPTPAQARDPRTLLEWWAGRDLDIGFLPTPIAEIALAERLIPGRLRTLLTGGDRLRTLPSSGRSFAVVNNYGPTENTVVATSAPMTSAAALHIGRPIANAAIYLLDRRGQPVPIGVAGEMYIGGAGVARGYWNRPTLTSERFVRDPFSRQPDARMYRTGDLARWRPDGNLDFLGRNDLQVKIRGFRIEPGEIEACLTEHPDVREAVVIASDDGSGEKRLIAYVVPRGDDALDPEELRRRLGVHLPDYMVPSAFVTLAELPLTANGKVDRNALPAPDGKAFALRTYEAPRGRVETIVAQIWSALLHVEQVGRHDNYFDLGGHSLLALQVISRLREALGVEVGLGALFAHPVLSDFSIIAGEARRTSLPPIVPVESSEREALSFAQQRLWFLAQLDPESTAYHIPFGLTFQGELDRDALTRALDTLVERHEVLRTTFVSVEGEPKQRIAPAEESRFTLAQRDLRTEADPGAELQRLAAAEAAMRFDLARGPLIRGVLIRTAEDEHTLLLTQHHIVTDGWSMDILLRELMALYGAYRAGQGNPLPPLRIQYADYAAWQRRCVTGEVLQEQAAYWKASLAGAPELLEVPGDRPRPAEQDLDGARIAVALDAELSRQVRELSRRHETTVFMTLLASWAAVLARLSGQEEVVVGTPVANRGRGEIESLMGFFTNTVALRIDVSGSPTVRELLRRVKQRSLEAQQNQDIPFEQVVDLAAPGRSLAHSPLFQTMFTSSRSAGAPLAMDGLTLLPAPQAELVTAKFDLSFSIDDDGETFNGSLEYATALFDRSTVERYAAHWRTLIVAMLADDERRIDELALLTGDERRLMLDEWNATDQDYPRDLCIHEWFEARAAEAPDAMAVVDELEEVTYGDLNARANRLAHALRERRIGPEDRVAICVERSVEMVVALLAVLKAGGAYVPLDPQHPAERLAYMIADSGAKIVLAGRSSPPDLAPLIPDGVAVLPMADSAHWAECADTNLHRTAVGITPTHVAYVIYTSGSTGRPKGVMVEHRSVVNEISDLHRRFAHRSSDRLLQFASITFDTSVEEIFCALLSGAALILRNQSWITDATSFWALCARYGVTWVHLPTRFWQLVARSVEAEAPRCIRLVLIGGEAVDQESIAAWFRSSRFRPPLFNSYGPTEATITATIQEVRSRSDWRSIGRPIANTRIYVLSSRREPAPIGVTGELYIAGDGLARGYQNAPELTAAAFVEDPFRRGGRMYRTGDLARYRPDGAIEFLGRRDDQVKINGFRIEPGEIEARLLEHPDVADAAVLPRKDDDVAGIRLVAYVVPAAGAGDTSLRADVLRPYLLDRLPDYMVPAAFVTLPSLPLTATGKLDRKSLAAPSAGAYAVRQFEPPRGAAERAVAEIWSDLLGLDQVGRNDNFFSAGGHSLLAVVVRERLAQRGLHVDVRTIFTAPTVAALAEAAALEEQLFEVPPNAIPSGAEVITPDMLPLVQLREEEIARVVAAVPGGARNVQDIYPLAPLQEGMVFHHLMAADRDPYVLCNVMRFDTRARLDGYLDALQRVIGRHDILRTAVVWEGLSAPVQVVWREARLAVEEVDVDPAEDAARQLYRRFHPRSARIDIRQAPLMRAYVALDAAQDRWMLLLLSHHLAGDHGTFAVMQDEIHAHLGGRADDLPPPRPFRELVARARFGASEKGHEEFFRRMLGDVDEPTAPFGLVEVRGDGAEIDEARTALGRDLSRRLRRRAQALGVSAATLCHVAWALVLARMSGRADVVFGTVLFGRMDSGASAERMMGLFINTLPIRIGLGNDTVEAGARRVHELLADLLRHEQASLALAQRCSAVPAPAPLFSAVLNYRHSGASPGSPPEPEETGIDAIYGEERTNYPLVLSVDDLGDELHFAAQVDASVGAVRVCRFMETAVAGLVDALEHAPRRLLKDIDVLPEEERLLLVGAGVEEDDV